MRNILFPLAEKGCTVVATVHQPSEELFGLFSRALLLVRGRVAWEGPTDPAGGSADMAALGFPLPRGRHVADFLMLLASEEGSAAALEAAWRGAAGQQAASSSKRGGGRASSSSASASASQHSGEEKEKQAAAAEGREGSSSTLDDSTSGSFAIHRPPPPQPGHLSSSSQAFVVPLFVHADSRGTSSATEPSAAAGGTAAQEEAGTASGGGGGAALHAAKADTAVVAIPGLVIPPAADAPPLIPQPPSPLPLPLHPGGRDDDDSSPPRRRPAAAAAAQQQRPRPPPEPRQQAAAAAARAPGPLTRAAEEVSVLLWREWAGLSRAPALAVAHAVVAAVLAVWIGALYWRSPHSQVGAQNRCGVSFFTVASFGFSSLSALDLFIGKAPLFRKEVHRFYGPTAFYFSKARRRAGARALCGGSFGAAPVCGRG